MEMFTEGWVDLATAKWASSPSFVRQPECNGCVERFIRTLKEQLLWVRVFRNVEELRGALAEFRERYNAGSSNAWATSRPPRLATSSLLSEPPHEYTQSSVQEIRR